MMDGGYKIPEHINWWDIEFPARDSSIEEYVERVMEEARKSMENIASNKEMS